MITNFNTYYINRESLKKFIEDKNIQNTSSLLIQVFTGLNDKLQIAELLEELNTFLSEAVIIGATTDGEIKDGKISSGEVVLSFTVFEHTVCKVAAVTHEANGYFSGKYLANKLIEDNTKLMIAFADGLHTNGEEFLNGISSVNSTIPVAGGHAGDNFEFEKTFVFTKEGIIEKGAVAVTLNSEHLNIFTDHSFHWHSIGNELTVTKAEGNRIYTIDNRTAVDTFAYYLGTDIAEGLPGIGIEFPLIVNRNGLDLARTTMAKEADGSLLLAGTLNTGEKVRIGFGHNVEIIKASQRIVSNTAKEPSEAIFIYSCTARKHFMGDEIEAEILPFQTIAPVSGFFTYGEFFSSSKKRELLNQTMTLVSLSESDRVHKKSPKKKKETINVTASSVDALTHLVNITSKELDERAETLSRSNQQNKYLRERIELALKGSRTSVLDWNFSGSYMYISASWKEMLGYSESEFPNSVGTWKKLVHPEDLISVLRQLKVSKKQRLTYFENNHRLKHKDGHWVWVLGRARILYDEQGEAIRMIGTHTDITEEKELQLKYFYQAQIIEQIHDSLTSTDLQGNIVSWNLGSEKIFGYKASEVIGKHISLLYPEEDRQELKKYTEVLMETGIYNADVILVKKSKERIPISFSLSLLKDQSGTPIGIVGINKDNTERKKAEDELYYQAHHDLLTNLPNRIMFRKTLKKGIENAQKNMSELALFFIDLDKFKDINDSLGHEVGDNVLKIISRRLCDSIRKEDSLSRLSGDEFTVIMEKVKDRKTISMIAQKILDVLSQAILIDEHTIYVSGSIGISMYPQDASDTEHLLKYADTAMYKAKEEGRNNYQFYTSKMTERALEKIAMKTYLREAIENEEFVIYYQPQVDAGNNTLVGMEALIRWNHPSKGLLYPDDFIPLAEETGMIIEIDRWVMKTSMKDVSEWYRDGLIPGVLALNLPIKHLESSDFLNVLQENIQKYNFRSEWLELEITEGQMIKKPEETIGKLIEINQLGVGISIDDFGTGYSSLALLKRLPINRLKIDKSFIVDIPKNTDSIAIVEAIVALSHSLKLDIIAEGVETKAQVEFLLNHGCKRMQGYYFGYPLSADELKKKFLHSSTSV